MNKKFLSAILFGALMVSSTGTFVSCKDYDDDIDRLDQEISNVKDAIKALEDKVGSGKYVESCTPFTDGNGGYEILHQCNAGCRRVLPYKVHCIHAIWSSMYPILHCTDAMCPVMQDCHAAYMALRIHG